MSDHFSNMFSINYPRETFYHKNLFPRNFSIISKTLIKRVPSQNKEMDNNLLFKKENLSMVSKDKDLKQLK